MFAHGDGVDYISFFFFGNIFIWEQLPTSYITIIKIFATLNESPWSVLVNIYINIVSFFRTTQRLWLFLDIRIT